MDPNTGRLYPSLADALNAGVEKPVEISGRPEDVERVSAAVSRLYSAEQKAAKRARNKAAKKARRASR